MSIFDRIKKYLGVRSHSEEFMPPVKTEPCGGPIERASEPTTYKLGSLFDGSGGFPLSGSLCGIVPVWAAEVEPYPIAVTRSRFPNMRHLGDISKVNGSEIEPVDIITFGSPCQDLSVAGKRAGLKHADNGDEETTRSGLFMEAVRIIKEMRGATNGKYPKFCLWENVPGAFSSNKGEDFKIVCEELIKIVEPAAVMPAVPKNGWPYADSYCGDGWSLAYRVFDAQYWGVPQRRRRIHLVVDFTGQCAGNVLFEREGVRGYFETGRTPWQGIAAAPQDCIGTADREGTIPYTLKIRSGCEGGGKGALVQVDKSATLATNNDQYLFQPVTFEPGIAQREGGHIYPGVSGTLRANAGDNQIAVAYADVILDDQGGQCITVRSDGKSPTLRAEMHGNIPCVMQTVKCYDIGEARLRNPSEYTEQTPTLTARCGTGGNNVPAVVYDARGNGDGKTVNTLTGDHNNRITDYTSVLVEPKPVGVLASSAENAEITDGTVSPCLMARAGTGGNQLPLVALDVAYCTDVGFFNTQENQAPTLLARMYKDPHLVTYPENEIRYIVRRLTPTECTRLQGFADNWGHIENKESMPQDELTFWQEVRNTHAAINGKAVKEYTEKQMLTWYNKLHTDSAEYKMWGNGIALPPALYCMQGIADALEARNT